MNQILGYHKNNGTLPNDDRDFDYIQIKLDGNHAKNTIEGNIMLL